ncbi:M28 family peptidase [Novosphingobium sp. HBC54]|uniref:M28 family peptidase n=2 Tax=Novosphingobium cyanobacteriorum TaxID=3024215 RepID=A0ABT6CK03_9SPHN|nr:M28 family peptidase [Novosphingobium cyanobacteriorum]
MHRKALRAISCSLAALAMAGSALAAAPKVPAVDQQAMRDTIKTLASDAFEGRGPSTPAEQKTLDEIVKRFKAAGLQPGNNGSWLQDVPMVAITARNPTPLTVTGGAQPLSFTGGNDFVIESYRVVPHTEIKDSELVFVGYGINAPELGWNDYAGINMKGKIAVILVNDPDYMMEGEDGPFRGRRMTWYGRWPYKYEEAARQGAKGALIVHDTFPAAYGWNVLQSNWLQRQNFVQSANDGMDQTEANGWMQKGMAEAIFKAAGKDFAAMVAAAGQKGFKAVPLGVKANVSFDNEFEKSLSHNVIGIQKGTRRPDEVVLYSGHWDHLGHCTPDAKGDGICNGAVDNATGIAALAELAAMNRRAGPAARSQVFLAVTLEESGLLGSEWYAQHPVYPLAKTVGGVNMDALYPTGPSRDLAVTGGDKSDLTAILRGVEKDMNLVETPEDHPERGHYYRSDHFSMAKRGVPMFAVGRGTDLINGGKAAGEAASEDYTRNRYHQPSDEYSDSWDMSGIAQEVELYYRLGRNLADGSAWPNWHAGDEFRAVRDKSLAEGK